MPNMAPSCVCKYHGLDAKGCRPRPFPFFRRACGQKRIPLEMTTLGGPRHDDRSLNEVPTLPVPEMNASIVRTRREASS